MSVRNYPAGFLAWQLVVWNLISFIPDSIGIILMPGREAWNARRCPAQSDAD